MDGDFLCGLVLLLIGMPGLLGAQIPASPGEMEDLLYRSESASIPEFLVNESMETGEAILDLNNATTEELETSGLFTPYQIHQLLKYREEFGEIFSIQELAVIPGFSQNKVKELISFVFPGPVSQTDRKIRPQHSILLHLGRSFPGKEDSLSRENNAFAGPPLLTCFRIKSRLNGKYSMALTYEKDAGESFLYKNKPQFLSGYLSLEGKGFCKQVVLGCFKLNQGAGLVNGYGFFHQVGKFRVSRQSLSLLRPYASKTESDFEQGIALQFDRNKIKFLLWASYRPLSLSPKAFTTYPLMDRWLDFERTTGLYRTEGELEGRALASRIHTGAQLLYNHNHLTMGIMSGYQWVYPSNKAKKYLDTNPGAVFQPKASLHANWLNGRLHVFGEMAVDENTSLAAIFGTNYHFSDYIQGSFLLHHYGTDFHGSYPSSYASGSSIKNEQGLAFYLHVETGEFVTMDLRGELFRYQAPRYLTELPSMGSKVDLSLQNPGGRAIQWRLRLVSKNWQSSPSSETSKLRPLLDSRVSRIDGQLKYKTPDLFNWTSRLVISWNSQQEEALPGYALMQQVTLCPAPKLKATLQFVQFWIEDWENRIYLYEPGFVYSFSFPFYYGKGQKTSFLLIWKPASSRSFSIKISGVTKTDHRQREASLQMLLKF